MSTPDLKASLDAEIDRLRAALQKAADDFYAATGLFANCSIGTTVGPKRFPEGVFKSEWITVGDVELRLPRKVRTVTDKPEGALDA